MSDSDNRLSGHSAFHHTLSALEGAQQSAAAHACLHALLLAAYAETHRAYHTREHLESCLESLEHAQKTMQVPYPAEIAVALWFHDAIYDTKAKDNEAMSAAWAERALADLGVRDEVIARVKMLVLATDHQASTERDAPPLDELLAQSVIVDCDLAILGAEAQAFDRYDAQIRDEYSWVPEADYKAGRAKVLQHFLDSSSIYRTEIFRDQFDQAARANLERAFQKL